MCSISPLLSNLCNVRQTSFLHILQGQGSISKCTLEMWTRPFVRGGEGFRRLYPDSRVPLSGRKHDHLIQELINTGQQVLSVLSLIRNVMKDLNRDGERQGIEVWKRPAEACSVSPGSELWCQIWGLMFGIKSEILHTQKKKNTAQYSGKPCKPS